MKNQIKLTLLFFFSFCIGVVAQNRSIQFEHGTWKEIKEKAAKEKKLIFLDAFTTWCGPCKWMAKNIFTNDTVADYFNEKFICAKFDMEAGEGVAMAKEYSIAAYPSLLFIDSEGKVVHRKIGASPDVQDYIELGNNALTTDMSYSSIVKKFESGERNHDFMIQYLNATAEAGLNTDKGVKAYFETQDVNSLSIPGNWNIINLYLNDMDSREFEYLLSNSDIFIDKYSEEVVNQKIYKVFEDACEHAIDNRKVDKNKYAELKERIFKSGFKNSEKLLLNSDLSFYGSQADWLNYSKTAEKLIEKYAQNDNHSVNVNNICWTIFEKVSDMPILTKAIQWSKKSIELGDPAFMDTYANLLFKAGNKKEAIQVEEKVVEILKKKPNLQFSIEDAEKTLKGFKNNLN